MSATKPGGLALGPQIGCVYCEALLQADRPRLRMGVKVPHPAVGRKTPLVWVGGSPAAHAETLLRDCYDLPKRPAGVV